MNKKIPIGAVAELTQIKVPTIRYYEEVGLLPKLARTSSNRRIYTEADVRRLRFIRQARELGFDLEAVRHLLSLAGLPDEPCDEADEIARARLNEIEHKIGRLTLLRRELQSMIDIGPHGTIRQCRIMEVLAGADDQV